jgi:CheY-like chemotaxis protein
LLVEDDPNDVLLIRRAFERAGVTNPIHVSRAGDSAVAYLIGVGAYRNRQKYPLPALVLLDLKMPGMNGFQLLRWIRHQPEFQDLRVVVLTASDHIQDVNEAYCLGANSFLVKPLEFENAHTLLATLKAQQISSGVV